VAMCAAVLGQKVRLVDLIDEARRETFTSWLRIRGVDFHGIDTGQPIRTCLAIRDKNGCITEILEAGPTIDADTWGTVIPTITSHCSDVPVAVLSGSLPPGAPASAYRDLVSQLSHVRVLVDGSGSLLRQALDARPFCVKPNREEAEALTSVAIDSPASAAVAARELVSAGVSLAIVSMGAAGAVACWQQRVCVISPPAVEARNPVGAGDCLLAGVAVALARGDTIENVLRLGVASGTAKVLSPDTGVVRREDIAAILPNVRLTWIG
jgi:1-phosphofructokinase family hexose kinase